MIEWITRAFSTRSYLDAFLSNFAGTSLVVQLGFGVAKSSFLVVLKRWKILNINLNTEVKSKTHDFKYRSKSQILL